MTVPVTRAKIVQRNIVRAAVQGLIDEGYMVSVQNAGNVVLSQSNEVHRIEAALASTGEDRLIAERVTGAGEVDRGSVSLEYDNAGWAVMCDYTRNLESALKAAKSLAVAFRNFA